VGDGDLCNIQARSASASRMRHAHIITQTACQRLRYVDGVFILDSSCANRYRIFTHKFTYQVLIREHEVIDMAKLTIHDVRLTALASCAG
jgi:hypothetical protein